MLVRIIYEEYGLEKGYDGYVRSKKELLEKLYSFGIEADMIKTFKAKKTGSGEYREYDPQVLKRA